MRFMSHMTTWPHPPQHMLQDPQLALNPPPQVFVANWYQTVVQ